MSHLNMLNSNKHKNRHMAIHHYLKIGDEKAQKIFPRQMFQPTIMHSTWQAILNCFIHRASQHFGTMGEWWKECQGPHSHHFCDLGLTRSTPCAPLANATASHSLDTALCYKCPLGLIFLVPWSDEWEKLHQDYVFFPFVFGVKVLRDRSFQNPTC